MSILPMKGPFRKKSKQMVKFQKNQKMKKWKIDFLEICNFSKKWKRKMNEKILKIKKGGARASRAPPIFWFLCFFLALPFFYFYEKLKISRKSIFHFFDFFEICAFLSIFIDFLRNGSHIEGLCNLTLNRFWKNCLSP